jgi:hypothetical protein
MSPCCASPWAALFLSCAIFFIDVALASAHHHAPCNSLTSDAVVDGLPFVQCARTPPCVRWNWANPTRCSQLRLDNQWPTWDPYVRRDHAWTSMRELLHEHVRGKTLMVVGDSITNLVYHGFVCEAARHGLTVTDDHPRLQAFVRRFNAIPKDQWVSEGAPHLYTYVVETDSIITMKGWAKCSQTDTAAFLSLADIVVVNYGLHYNSMDEYRPVMDQLFKQLKDFNEMPGKTALFREISAQAFENTGAYTPGADKVGGGCAPTPPEHAHDNDVVQQNALVSTLAKQYEVPMLEFYNTTLPRWNAREERFCEYEGRRNNPNAVCLDCTHLCWTPTLWAREVDKLSKALSLMRSR